MAETINPYNFVPLGKEPDRSLGYPGRHRVRDTAYSGKLACRLVALSSLFSADHQKSTTGLRFLRNSQQQPIIPGTSLKGMIRSVYEAMVNACLPFAAVRGEKYEYNSLGAYQHLKCSDLEKLCPACRLFGTIQGDAVHSQGRVRFTDAVTKGPLVTEQLPAELYGPKPHHHATYGKDGKRSGEIAGRKFYYHQAGQLEKRSPVHSRFIDEHAPSGTEFLFDVFVDNLAPEEVGRILLALELHDGLAHKIGMGKAIGLGSCQIRVDQDHSHLWSTLERYGVWDSVRSPAAASWTAFKSVAEPLPASLIEVLRLDKPKEGKIGYPGRPYLKSRIDARGVFGGKDSPGGQPGKAFSLGTTYSIKDEKPSARKLAGGARVQCILLEEKTKKGGWKAKLKDGDGEGAILPGNEPQQISPGQEVELIVQSTDPKNMSFRWPTGKNNR